MSDFTRRESLGYQVNHLARLMAQALRTRIEPHGVVPGQFAQLLALYEEDGLTQNDLCARVRIDQSTMAHTLKRMERDGLIDRIPDPNDRRRASIRLSPRAQSLRDTLVQAAEDVNAEATRGLDDDERATCLALVTQVIANLEPSTPLDQVATA
ncbi:MarR family winged helix-turn-helix transcriptional regulator [Aeromicrobium sp.]|uniref:MarR family winged helix-turn-helix transcriptional regulator n=1 Tax=Aeromicrobium sp. TaxID=1871063 RepID=UPI003D6BD7F2